MPARTRIAAIIAAITLAVPAGIGTAPAAHAAPTNGTVTVSAASGWWDWPRKGFCKVFPLGKVVCG